MSRRPGLTLIEMLVVLSIMAVLTTLAVVATEGIVDQARYDVTQRTLQNIQDAIMGPAGQRGGDGSQLITGFVADMGRLPQPVFASGATTPTGDPLRELWDPTAIAANLGTAFNAQQLNLSVLNTSFTSVPLYNAPSGAATTAASVTIPCGWRGPYLQLPPGNTSTTTGYAQLLDGWGNQFQSLYQIPSSTAFPVAPLPASGNTPAQPINVVCSLGADNTLNATLPTNAYDLDQFVPAQTTAPPTAPLTSFSNSVYGTVNVTVQSINSSVTPVALTSPFPTTETAPMVCVVIFAPSNGLLTQFNLDSTASPNTYNPLSTPATYLTNPNPKEQDFSLTATPMGATPGTTTTPVSGSFVNVPIGSRAIQAFQYDATPTTSPSGGQCYKVFKRSPLIYLNVLSSGVSITLVLQ